MWDLSDRPTSASCRPTGARGARSLKDVPDPAVQADAGAMEIEDNKLKITVAFDDYVDMSSVVAGTNVFLETENDPDGEPGGDYETTITRVILPVPPPNL